MLQPLCRYTRGVNQEYGNLFKSSFAFISLLSANQKLFRTVLANKRETWCGTDIVFSLSFNREKSDPLTLMG